jgi:peptidyl-prolyl cis-trans isomerase B (cyclophilin B)
MIMLAAAIVLGGCGSSSHSSGGATARSAAPSTNRPASPSSSKATAPSAGGCQTVPTPVPKLSEEHLPAPTLRLDPSQTYTVSVVTNCGTFAFALDVRHSPKTAASVYALVKRGFYDGLAFERVAAGFIIQGGDPAGDGSGGPGYTVIEPPPRNTQYLRGDVAMAKTQVQPSGASGSQFFVVTGANVTQSTGLTPDYARLGKVVSGQRVVDTIGALPTNPPGDGAPSPTVVMSRVTVATS